MLSVRIRAGRRGLFSGIYRQADKDNIFVAKGQEMIIKGSVLLDEKFKGVLITEQARINMKTFWR